MMAVLLFILGYGIGLRLGCIWNHLGSSSALASKYYKAIMKAIAIPYGCYSEDCTNPTPSNVGSLALEIATMQTFRNALNVLLSLFLLSFIAMNVVRLTQHFLHS